MTVIKCLISVQYVFTGIESSSMQDILLNDNNRQNLDTIQNENIIVDKNLVLSKNNEEMCIIQQKENCIERIKNKNANTQVVIYFYFLHLVKCYK